MQADEFLYF